MDFSRGIMPFTDEAVTALDRQCPSAQEVDDALKADRQRIRKMLETAKQGNDDDVLIYLTHEVIPGHIEDVDRRILDAKAILAKRSRRQMRRHRELLARYRGHLRDMVWEFDPDACGGETFDNADDLIASLRA